MDLEILDIASDNDNNRSIQDYTHQSKLKNPLCGDEILINLIIKKDKIVEFGYQGKSCVYCQASANLLSKISINKQKSKINELCDDAKLFFESNKVAEIPINILTENAPVYERKWKKTKLPQKIKFKKDDFKKLKIAEVLKKILSLPNISSKEWIWEQYDHTVMGDTIQKPGSDAGVVRVHGTSKAVATSVDSSAIYCNAHPLTGGKQVVCESWRNLISCGSKPIAITNCLNFGNPEKEKNMGEFVECVEGINEASKFLDYPIVSGNVSFYNETKDK